MNIIHLLSGGLDSTMLLYDLKQQGNDVDCLLFDYGQTHIQELGFARRHCDALAVPFTVIELHRIKGLFARSMLTDGQGSKIVPNRNSVFLNIAASIAESRVIGTVSIASNADDRKDFPDCRREFFKALNACFEIGGLGVQVIAPYGGLTKWQIVQRSKEHGWPYLDTMSCYAGNNCGSCDACKQRQEALK